MKKLIAFILCLSCFAISASGQATYLGKSEAALSAAKQATSDSLALALLKTAAGDSIRKYIFDFIPVPTDADTSIDSVNKMLYIIPVSRSTAGIDSSSFIEVSDYHATAAADSVALFKTSFISFQPDTLYCYAFSDSVSKLIGAHISITGRDGTVILNQTVSPSVTGGWQRFAFYRAANAIPQDYKVVYRIKNFKGKTLRITPVFMKRVN